MSTTIKRISLVAVAALGLSLVSVAPSNAAINQDSLTLTATTAAQTTAETFTATSAVATLSFLGSTTGDSASVTAALVSGPAGNTALPYLRLTETTSATINNANTTAVGTDVDPNVPVAVGSAVGGAASSAKFAVYLSTNGLLAPTVAGTYVVRITPATIGSSGALLGAKAVDLTITVTTAAALDTVATSATSILNAGETSSATVDAIVTASRTAEGEVAVATIVVDLKNAAGSAVTAESFTATIAGAGTLGAAAKTGTTITGPNAAGRALLVKNGHVVQVFADGTSGVGTITIAAASGVVVATETVTFFGAATTVVATAKKPVIGGTSAVAEVLEVVVKDSAGVSVSNLAGKIGVVSSDTTKIATAYTPTSTYSATTGSYLVHVTPGAIGSANLTATTKASATATTGVDAAAVSVRVGSSTPASVAVALDKTSYAPGEKATISISLKDATGLDLAAGDYTGIFAAGGITANYTLGSGSETTTGTYANGYEDGAATYTIYMPVTEGDVVFSWTTGSVAATSGAGLATANQAVKGSVTASVSSPGSAAATDAANEATDAANAATDAALAAAEAADAATSAAQEASDAVAALSETVTKLIAGLQSQIKSLAAVVARIAKQTK
jgi:hypothetical protein